MTPQEKLKHIKELDKDDWFCDNPNGADIREEIYWLVARVEQLEGILSDTEHTEEDIFNALHTGPKS